MVAVAAATRSRSDDDGNNRKSTATASLGAAAASGASMTLRTTTTTTVSGSSTTSMMPHNNALAGVSLPGRASTTTTTTRIQQKRYRSSSILLLLEFILTMGVFVCILQVFDPFSSLHHENDYAVSSTHNFQPYTSSKNALKSSLRALQQKLQEQSVNASAVISGREFVLELLQDAMGTTAIQDLPVEGIQQLPTIEQLRDLYDLPETTIAVHGMEQCEQYRNRVATADRYVAPAGLFNTGTNLLWHHLQHNIHITGAKKHYRWQVAWGKHRTASSKWNHTATTSVHDDKNAVLPVVIIRDPYHFFQSMCAHPYSAQWRHESHHCPNLIANEEDRKQFQHSHDVIPVRVTYAKGDREIFTSLAHLWSAWYQQYYDYSPSDDPALIIRYEDLLFQPKRVLQFIADCVGGHVAPDKFFSYQVETSKSHGSGTDMIKALIKAGSRDLRIRNMTKQDLDYSRQHLAAELMSTFHYQFP